MALTVAVTVTYGARWHLLKEAIEAALEDGVGAVVLVDNGSSGDVASHVATSFQSRVTVVRNARNLGSAAGFARGMEEALKFSPDYVLLLDDDNAMIPGCLATLEATYVAWSSTIPEHSLAVLAHRPSHLPNVEEHGIEKRMLPPRAAFFGFSVTDIPNKLWRRVRSSLGRGQAKQQPGCIVVETAPYSGLFFKPTVITSHGIPDERFVLYADDTDFSFRLSAAGGRIVMNPEAQIRDIEPSWNVPGESISSFDVWLLGSSDMRAYYAARNHAYWERFRRGGHGVARAANREVFLGLLTARGRILGKPERVALLKRAIRDGEAEHLGEHPHYPLT
jgi:GT2 family glycosyltransferase